MNLDLEEIPLFLPLSFTDSDVHLVFTVYLYFILFPLGLFLLELFWNCRLKRLNVVYYTKIMYWKLVKRLRETKVTVFLLMEKCV